jgi:hypothetical protein
MKQREKKWLVSIFGDFGFDDEVGFTNSDK